MAIHSKNKSAAKFNNVVRTPSKKIKKENERILHMKYKPRQPKSTFESVKKQRPMNSRQTKQIIREVDKFNKRRF